MSSDKNLLVSWEFLLVKLVLFAMLFVAFDKPCGSVIGKIALEQKNFDLYSYDIGAQKVYALAVGPRGKSSDERGVWIKSDGTFVLPHLPVGEYTIKLRAPGFASEYINGVFVDEGKVTKLKSPITLDLLEPSVTLASNTRVYTTKEKPKLWINAYGGTLASVDVYKADFLQFMNQCAKNSIEVNSSLDIYKPSDSTELNLQGTPVATMTRQLELDTSDWSYADFQLSNTLPPGDYVAKVKLKSQRGEKSSWDVLWFSVTDLGLIVKQAPDKTVIRAIDLNTLGPRKGVALSMFDRRAGSSRTLGQATTDSNGFATIGSGKNLPSNLTGSVLISGVQGNDRAYSDASWWQGRAGQYRTYFYTERPIYRLGQTVSFKGIARKFDETGFHNPKGGLPVTVTIEDPDNQKVAEQRLRTNEHGTFNGTFDVPADGHTGAYQVTVKYPDDTSTYNSFEVAQYRKPEYQVEVTPVTPRVIAGSTLKARIKATYYFGAPVASAKVKYSVYAGNDWQARENLLPRPEYYDFFDDWGDDADYSYASDFVCEGYAQTDDAGEAVIEFKTKDLKPPTDGPYSNDYQDKKYKIEAEVTDLSRIAVVGNGSASVVAGDYALFVKSDSYVAKSGEPISVNINAINYDGQPATNKQVDIRLMRWVWDQTASTYRGVDLSDHATATTNDKGVATVSLKTQDSYPTETYYITAQSKDSSGHTIYDNESIWIASSNYPYALSEKDANVEPLSLKLDKPVYKPGDTARVMISTPTTGKEGSEAIVSVEGKRLYNYRVVPLKATATLVEIPITEEYAPNAFVACTFVDKKHQFYNQSQILKVSPDDNFLNVSITTDKPKYKPGESVQYTIKALDSHGKPSANTEVSLGVVDESIYAIRPEAAEDIRKFFYRMQENWVNTVCSFPHSYSGGPDKVEPRMRKDFRDTAAWLPDLVTNKDGIAIASVKLPDNLTTWRATARAIGMATTVGDTINKIISTQDLIVRLALPRFFTEGDEGYITAIVHNYTDAAENIDLSLTATKQYKLAKPTEQRLLVKADKAERYSWPITVVGSGDSLVSIIARGKKTGDAMEMHLPVRSLGIKAALCQSKIITNESQSAFLPVSPDNPAAKDIKWQLALAASSIGPVLGSFNSLIDYPYGCTEQTMSRLVPSIVAMKLNKELGQTMTSSDKERFRVVYNKSIQKLAEHRHADGGWGWWKFDDSDPSMTSYVMEGLMLLKEAGYKVEDTWLSEGKAWLSKNAKDLFKQLSDPKQVDVYGLTRQRRIDLTRMLYVLSKNGQAVPNNVRSWYHKNLETMQPEELTYLTLAIGNNQLSKPFYDRLIALANNNDGMTDWDHTRALLNKIKIKSDEDDYTYQFTGVETTAVALQTVLACEPQNSARIESIKRWLLLQHDKDGWENTKTTAKVFLVLLQEEILARKSGTAGTNYTVSVNSGQTPTSAELIALHKLLTFTDENRYDEDTVISENIPAGTRIPSTAVELKKQGPGRLYYTNLITYTRKLHPGDTINEKSLPANLAIKRSFFRLKPTSIASDGTTHFNLDPISNNVIKAGETVLMKVSVNSPVALPYVILEAALPSGAEVVSDDPRADLIDQGSSNRSVETDWGTWWWSHQDILDDKVVFFAKSMPAGKCEFQTLVRMELPGKFQINPMSLHGMYTDHVRALSSLDSITVKE
ncbi:MAG: hypothetical protein K2Y22_05025 [Candidatus Obscuribacterales bacterium]|nr:hypothetical protein [Candidatus Obscuribacterales bacterium]